MLKLSRSARRDLSSALAGTALVFAVGTSWADDWPGYLGIKGDGTSAEATWNQKWSDKEPEILWQAEVGTGCSSMTVAEGRLYTLGQSTPGQDTVWCFDAVSGDKIWQFSYEQKLEPTYYSGGPSSTPVWNEGKLYVISKDGALFCLDANDGKEIWKKSLTADFGGRKQTWGYASSPLIIGSLLIVEPGGSGSSVVALDKATGDLIWKAGDDLPGYATPVHFKDATREGIVCFNHFGLVGYDLQGKQLFRQEWKTQYDVNAANPLFADGKFFISSGYNTGAALVTTQGESAELVWKNKALFQQFQNMVLVDGYVYAVSGDNQSRAQFKCVNFETGEVMWEERLRENRGNILCVNGLLLVLSESGELLLVKPDPNAMDQLGSIQVNRKPCWAPPAFSNGLFYSRNNDGRLACVDMR